MVTAATPPWRVPATERTPRRCAACGGEYHVEVGQTPEQADQRHGEAECRADELREVFFATPYGQGVLDAMEDEEVHG